ncbi:hypothetical protein U2I54_15445 [Bacillus pseudomycoides]|uniref:Fur-regulated basic protein FbpA n=1 Tax=Bacillus bingmayongensis TaxID=1150157 RepID=A0ABU5JYJ0_9BACI|nr:hypothetical protein [Bacillus pseudomycoides]
MKKNVEKEVQEMISFLLGNTALNNNTRYAFEELHKKGFITNSELDHITRLVETKKGIASC